MSTKENTFEIGELVKLKYTDYVGIIVDTREKVGENPMTWYYNTIEVKWQSSDVVGNSNNRCWHTREELEPVAY